MNMMFRQFCLRITLLIHIMTHGIYMMLLLFKIVVLVASLIGSTLKST